ncbi:hypothetical protein O6H91_01G124100 [Diphasiastrum complanatum]|uniref:Uncharacterized protein n=1 Tax=Diphasiastrum complanatum TaxID=34168 RepID=A0ACC2EVQ1_DIPCM|nr:hypothetical protein O6H91_01G124100 [Diphasiastrum complanatum]
MVWSLSAENNSAPLVPPKYHFTSPGTYKVGRKDCHVILQADRTVSRLHAELTISPATPWLPTDSTTDIPAPELFLKDHSKFGTFVGKATGAKPVFSSPDRVVSVKDGDLLTFGTGNTTFRLSYMPMVFCLSSLADNVKESTQNCAASVGAYVIDKWTKCCTHLLVKDGSEVTDDVFAAVIQKKLVTELEWLQAVIARGAPGDEFPAMPSFLPTLMFKGHDIHTPVKLSEPNVREAMFQGFVFLIGPSYLYQYGKHLRHILEAVSGKIQDLSGKKDISQFHVSGKNYVVIVPDGAVESRSSLISTAIHHHLNSTSEGKIIQVVLTGQRELLSTIFSARSAGGQATSASTEETLEVVDSEEDINSAALCNEDDRKIAITTITNVEVNSVTNASLTRKRVGTTDEPNLEVDHIKESPCKIPQIITRKSVAVSKQTQLMGSRTQSGHTPVDTRPFKLMQDKSVQQPSEIVSPLDSKVKYITTQVEETMSIDSCKNIDPSLEVDVQYSCLIVQKDWSRRSLSDAANGGSAPNFKLFKKVAGPSGNSFTDLVPFAKEPYRDSDYGREVEEYMQREKKRKEAERLAEDLFNAERLKRQKATSGESLRDSVGISSTFKGMVGRSGRK